MKTAEQIDKVLKEISSRIPKNLLKNVYSEVPASPTAEFVVNKALEDPNFPEEKKVALRTLKEAGEFNKRRIVENPKIAKMIDNWMGREINKAIKLGRLPQRGEIKNLKHVKELYEKIHHKENKGEN